MWMIQSTRCRNFPLLSLSLSYFRRHTDKLSESPNLLADSCPLLAPTQVRDLETISAELCKRDLDLIEGSKEKWFTDTRKAQGIARAAEPKGAVEYMEVLATVVSIFSSSLTAFLYFPENSNYDPGRSFG
jgi:hypothetical protein